MAHPSELISRAGGDETVAKACGVTPDALRKWREIGRVPPKHWSVVASLASATLDEVAAASLKAAPTDGAAAPLAREEGSVDRPAATFRKAPAA